MVMFVAIALDKCEWLAQSAYENMQRIQLLRCLVEPFCFLSDPPSLEAWIVLIFAARIGLYRTNAVDSPLSMMNP